MNLPDHIHPIAVDDALLNIGMTINEIRALTGDPAPTVIRTVEELWSMDLDTLLYCGWQECHYLLAKDLHPDHLPAVVVLPADQVRAARKALEEA